jgi:hypothetical protein
MLLRVNRDAFLKEDSTESPRVSQHSSEKFDPTCASFFPRYQDLQLGFLLEETQNSSCEADDNWLCHALRLR